MRFEEFIYYERKDAARKAAKEAAKEATEKTLRNTKIQDIFELLEDYGEIPPLLTEKLEAVRDIDLLKKYLKCAAKADSLEAFMAMLD